MTETTLAAPHLRTERLVLRMARESDIPAILAYFEENRARFAPTDPPKPARFHTAEFWQSRIKGARKAWEAEQGLALYLFAPGSSELVGTVSFSQMCRGPLQACYLGYGLSGRHEGQGLMTEAVQAAITFVFGELNFHRIMANHLPENQRSAAVLQRLGFEREGLARDYLFINGRWRDHVLNALANPNWKSA